MDSDSYKTMIKQTVRSTAFRDLNLIKEGHSKVRDIVYLGLKYPQPYHTDKTVTTQERSVIFGLKSRSIRGIKSNFKSQYSDNTLCTICERSEDLQEHIGCCPVLLAIKPQEIPIIYKHIYGSVEQQKKVAQQFIIYLQLRDELLAGGTNESSSLPGLYTGPVRPQAGTQQGQARRCS